MTPTRNEDDELLMRRIREDDETALHTLLGKYYAVLCRYAHTLLHNRALAEEAVSDVFLNLWNIRARISITSCVFHYLHRSVGNRSRNLREKDASSADLVPIDDVAPDLLADAGETGDRLLYSELQIAIEAMIARMPAQRQAVFRMNRLEGKRYKQIAEELGLTVNTVQKHMVLAMRQIAEDLPKIRTLLEGDSRGN
ncbi:RNA polymerase subunit sigma-24 [Opitutaceae bacterium TAV5]|nr:RNA polymerase subunit sigma-24 [Opitutaceae bacterium TAV5]